MTWGTLEIDEKKHQSQLWKKIKRLEKEVESKDGTIIELRAQVEAQSDYEDILKENEDLKKENANLKRSNTMLKYKQTT